MINVRNQIWLGVSVTHSYLPLPGLLFRKYVESPVRAKVRIATFSRGYLVWNLIEEQLKSGINHAS